jgi:hypothetical protein
LKPEELIVKRWLDSLGHSDIQYEPVANRTPDFLVNGNIAIEVRRLNESIEYSGQLEGVEQRMSNFIIGMQKLCATFNPEWCGGSWWVTIIIRRPSGLWRDVRNEVKRVLNEVARSGFPLEKYKPIFFTVSENIILEISRSEVRFETPFRWCGFQDLDSGGSVEHIYITNLTKCISEKSAKVRPFVDQYAIWNLVLVNALPYSWEPRWNDDSLSRVELGEFKRVTVIRDLVDRFDVEIDIVARASNIACS